MKTILLIVIAFAATAAMFAQLFASDVLARFGTTVQVGVWMWTAVPFFLVVVWVALSFFKEK